MSIRSLGACRFLFLILSFTLLAAGCGSKEPVSMSEGKSGANTVKTMSWDKMPQMAINLDKQYSAKVVTSEGDFVIKLFAKAAPITVNNFVFLANEGFYDGLTFHSVIESFMIQSGDPKGNGTGNAGYRIPDELNANSAYKEGTVAMFNTGSPNSGSSQFFICTGPEAANLNRQPNYTIFGEISSGMDTVRAIASTPVKNHLPLTKIVIESITIEAV